MRHARVVVSLASVIVLGVILFLSPLRDNTVGVVGVYAFLSTIIVFLVQTIEIKIIEVGEENAVTEIRAPTTSHKENLPYKILSYTPRSVDYSYTEMSSAKEGTFYAPVYSSENQLTMSSLYKPTRAIPVELPQKEENDRPRVPTSVKKENQGKNKK